MNDEIGRDRVRGFGPMSIGPISERDAVDLAVLTGDFSPPQVIPQAASSAGLSAAVLHSAWVSGLVSAGLFRVFGGRGPREFEIVYRAVAYQEEKLIFGISVDEKAEAEKKSGIAFEVRAGGRRLIAEGHAVN